MSSTRRSVIRCGLRRLGKALITFGTLWVYIPPTPSPPELRGTAPHHPERVCPEAPLTPVERAIEQELRDLADPGAPQRGPGGGSGTG